MNFEDLTPEQKERAKSCTSSEELARLAAEEGVELSDEQLADVAGGAWGECEDYVCNHQPCDSKSRYCVPKHR